MQIAADLSLAKFPTPEYAQLYAKLMKRGLSVIGVEFVSRDTYEGSRAPDWQCTFPATGFELRAELMAWSEIRHAAYADNRPDIADVAARCKTYLDLLSIRVWQLSKAYNQMLRAWRVGDGKIGHHFGNTFMPHIDAAMHGFLSDAGSFRDLIAEIAWRFLLGGDASVTTLASFLKKAKASTDPIAQEIIAAGQDGQWLKRFTDLRNDIVHVAPVGRSSSFHACQVREHDCGNGIKLPALHYPILAADGTVWKGEGEPFDHNDEPAIIAALQRYDEFLSSSIDGLDYAWRTLGQFVELLRKVRGGTGFRGEMMTITDDDIIGEVTFR